MGEKITMFLLLLLSTLIPTSLSTTSPRPPPPLSTTPSPSPLSTTITPPPPQPLPPALPLNGDDPATRLQQIYNIIDALIGSGDFGNWVNILSAADLSMFPISATLFIPDDVAFSLSPDLSSLDPFLFPYHIVPQRLTFSDLLLFETNTRIPTLLRNHSILITNSSLLNFTLDGSPLTRPDLLATDDIVVHGIGGVLDYTVYGQDRSSAAAVSSSTSVSAPAPQPCDAGGGSTVPFWPLEDMNQASCGDCLGSKSHMVSFVLVTFWFLSHSRLL